jgi:hypothetical protein
LRSKLFLCSSPHRGPNLRFLSAAFHSKSFNSSPRLRSQTFIPSSSRRVPHRRLLLHRVEPKLLAPFITSRPNIRVFLATSRLFHRVAAKLPIPLHHIIPNFCLLITASRPNSCFLFIAWRPNSRFLFAAPTLPSPFIVVWCKPCFLTVSRSNFSFFFFTPNFCSSSLHHAQTRASSSSRPTFAFPVVLSRPNSCLLFTASKPTFHLPFTMALPNLRFGLHRSSSGHIKAFVSSSLHHCQTFNLLFVALRSNQHLFSAASRPNCWFLFVAAYPNLRLHFTASRQYLCLLFITSHSKLASSFSYVPNSCFLIASRPNSSLLHCVAFKLAYLSPSKYLLLPKTTGISSSRSSLRAFLSHVHHFVPNIFCCVFVMWCPNFLFCLPPLHRIAKNKLPSQLHRVKLQTFYSSLSLSLSLSLMCKKFERYDKGDVCD